MRNMVGVGCVGGAVGQNVIGVVWLDCIAVGLGGCCGVRPLVRTAYVRTYVTCVPWRRWFKVAWCLAC